MNSLFDDEQGLSSAEMALFLALLVVFLGGAIIYMQSQATARHDTARTMYSTYELPDPRP